MGPSIRKHSEALKPSVISMWMPIELFDISMAQFLTLDLLRCIGEEILTRERVRY